MQASVAQLVEMGQLPSDCQDVDDSVLKQYEKLLGEIRQPINMDEAKHLIGLFPEAGLFGLEWTLLHLLESVTKHHTFSPSAYKEIINQCPSDEWKKTLAERFNG